MNTLEQIKIKLKVEDNIANPIRVPGIKREYLAILFADLQFKKGVEIGVHKAYFSGVLCKMNTELALTSVDIWRREEFYCDAIRNVSNFNCRLIRMTSIKAATLFDNGSLDFVFIDGDHRYLSVKSDIEAWEPKVRIGGVVSGHDYKVSNKTLAGARCEVVKAVDEYVTKHRINPLFIIGENFQSWPSWFWVKI